MKGWDMNIFHIMDFLKITELGSFSEAADELYITQSALSKHVQLLEKTLGVELFIRSHRKPRLSPGGTLFLPYAKQFENLYLKMNKDLQKLIGQEQLQFTLGCLPTMAFYQIMETVAAFRRHYPNININVTEITDNSKKNITGSLVNGEFDMVFCDSIFISGKKYEALDYCDDRLIAVLNPNHPLASRPIIELSCLENEALVFMDKRTTTYFHSVEACKKAGFDPQMVFFGNHLENIYEYIMNNNRGIALMFKKFTKHANTEQMIVRELSPTTKRTIALARLLKKHQPVGAQLFWDYIAAKVQAEVSISPIMIPV